MKTLLPAALSVLLLTMAFTARSAEEATPYRGKMHSLPGKIEAEDYDERAAGVAYRGADKENRGVAYWPETEVDLEGRDDASKGIADIDYFRFLKQEP